MSAFKAECSICAGVRRPQRQQECRKTKGSMSWQKDGWARTLCTCVINLGTFLCRPLQNSNVKFCVVWRTGTTMANFSYFYLELNAFLAFSAGARFNAYKQLNRSKRNEKFQSKIATHFVLSVVLAVNVVYQQGPQ